MSGKTHGSEPPRMAASGQRIDAGAHGEAGWARAISGLTAELRSRGLETSIDDRTGVVEATAAWPGRRTQHAVLRPHRGRLWWWLRWEDDASGASDASPGLALQHTPLTPAAHTGDAARRILGVLDPAGTRRVP